MSKEDKLIPELRFPEFINEGEWEEKKLENYIDLFSGIALKSEELSDDKSGVPILRGINITEGCVRHSKDIDKYYLGDINNLEKFLVKENDIVIGMDGSKVGKNVAMITKKDENSILIQRVARIRINKDADINFIYQFFISDKFINYVDTVNTSSGIPHISAQQIKDSKVGFPPDIKEQQKIASCLSSLAEVITAQTQKLDLLKDHKKGLMQNLFPQEGETVPKYRFKDFEKDGEWVEKAIEKIAKVSAGGTPESTNPDYWNGDIPWMNSGELNNKRIYSVSNFITKEGYENSSTKLIPPNCVLIGLAGQGKTRGTAAINYIELCTNQSIGSIHPNYSIFDSEFLYHKIDSMYEILRSISAGDGGRGGLNLQIIKDIKLSLPSIQEQQKIASCLSSLDTLITAQAEKIEQLKLHKKGLMQGLFPKING